MDLVSTSNSDLHANFATAVEQSLPIDGGLWTPNQLEPLPNIDQVISLPWLQRCAAILTHLLGDEMAASEIEALVNQAFDLELPLVEIAPQRFVLELFHGPSLAFKDFGARFLAALLARPSADPRPRTVLTATSGDTGAAVAQALWRQPHVRALILYPNGRVSPSQEQQLAALGDNIAAFAIDGTFDDCQALAKACFADQALAQQLRLISANSIHIARLLAQILYYFEINAQLRKRGIVTPPVIAVPSGNFGNLCAGLFAQRLGLPVHAFVAATNANSTVADFLAGAAYLPRPSVATLSNAMDVGAPSNWARIVHLFQHDLSNMRRAIRSGFASDQETKSEILRLHALGYLADPHTAVASAVLERHIQSGEVGVVLATAHPAKFTEVLRPLVGEIALPPVLLEVAKRPLQREILPNNLAVVKNRLLSV